MYMTDTASRVAICDRCAHDMENMCVCVCVCVCGKAPRDSLSKTAIQNTLIVEENKKYQSVCSPLPNQGGLLAAAVAAAPTPNAAAAAARPSDVGSDGILCTCWVTHNNRCEKASSGIPASP
jgi:hypothetical protein